MAGVGFNVSSDDVSLSAATPKTVLQITAATNQRVVIHGVAFCGKSSAGGTDAAITVRTTYSTANFGTGTSKTPSKQIRSDPETLQTTAKANFTVEPTSPTEGMWHRKFNPQTSDIEFFPPGMKIIVPGGYAVNFEATSAGTPTLEMTAHCEE